MAACRDGTSNTILVIEDAGRPQNIVGKYAGGAVIGSQAGSTQSPNIAGYIASIDDTRHDLSFEDNQPVEGAGFTGICNGRSVCSVFLPASNAPPKVSVAAGLPLPLQLDSLSIEVSAGVRLPLP